MKILQVHVKKLDDRSKDVVYLGKESGTKASHLYDPVTGRLYVSRDVLYQEDEVWPGENKYKDDEEVRFPSSYILMNTDSSETECLEDGSETSTPATTPVHTPMHTPMSSSVHTSMSSQFDTPVNSSTKNESLSPEISDASSKP